MMKFTLTSVALLSALLLSGCAKPSEQDLLQQGKEAFEQGKPEDALGIYEEYLRDYPEGKEKPEVLYAMGVVYQNARNDIPMAIKYYRDVADEFPGHPRAPGALFLVGFLYNNELKNLDSANVAYQEFLQRFPNDPMAPSARFELSHLGVEPEKILSGNDQAPAQRKAAKRKRSK